MSESLTIGDLTFALRWSSRRKTVGLTVERDGSVTLTAPVDCPAEVVEHTARAKLFWVYTKLAQQDLLARPGGVKEFVTGEGFYYLGRSYRLLLIDPTQMEAAIPGLRLHQGRFLLRRDARSQARRHFLGWYTQHGRPWLQRRVDLFAERIGVAPRGVAVQDLRFRWGSCGADGTLNFHWRTVLLPPRISDYIVAHELVHLHAPHHGVEFWRRLERTMPDFAARKQWLAENGGRFYC